MSIHCLFAFGAGIWNWSLVQMSMKKHLLYNLNWSWFEHICTVCARVSHAVLCYSCMSMNNYRYKSVMGEFFFLACETQSSTRFSITYSRFSIHPGIENRELSRESRLATDCQLTFEQYVLYTGKTFLLPKKNHQCKFVWLLLKETWIRFNHNNL